MGQLDERVITNTMKKTGLPREVIEKALKELIDEGYLMKRTDNNMLSQQGIDFVEKEIFKKKS